MSLSFTIFEIQQNICQRSQTVMYPTSIWCPRWGDSIGISPRSLA